MRTVQESKRKATWLVQHPLSAEDEAVMVAMRSIVEPNRGKLQGIAARAPFDTIMERVSAPAGVIYEADSIGGVPGMVVQAGWRTAQSGRYASSRRMVQLGLCAGVSPSGGPHRPECPDSDFLA